MPPREIIIHDGPGACQTSDSALVMAEQPQQSVAGRHRHMVISVITPSFNNLPYLRRCCISVADQEGVTAEHIIMDGGSRDGTVEWLEGTAGRAAVPGHPAPIWESEPDDGMYDAINKGWSRASGDVLCWLNCDEQYLPGALARVAQAFAAHPDADIVFGDVLLIRPDGSLIAYRKSMPLRWPYVLAAHLYVPSCAMFFRRRFFDAGLRFDVRWRAAGDAELVVRLLRRGARAFHLREYLACFTQTGHNLGATERAAQEGRQLLAIAPRWVRLGRPLLCAARWVEKILHGCYGQRGAIAYDVFTAGATGQRQHFSVTRASHRWREH